MLHEIFAKHGKYIVKLLFAETVKFNIKNNALLTSQSFNPSFTALTAKQKKRKRNKMNRMMKKLQMEPMKKEDSDITVNKPPIIPTKFSPKFIIKTSPLLSSPFNSVNSAPTVLPNKIPPPPGCEDVKPLSTVNNSQNGMGIHSTSLTNQSSSNDYFAKINKAKCTMDMSEWPQSLMYVHV